MTKKVGRNDPCPCGSGKKYKQCCMKKDQEATAAKYTAAGKRKFKAKVLSSQGIGAVFQQSAKPQTEASDSGGALQRLKIRMTEKDFQVKEEEATPSETSPSEEETAQPTEKKISPLDETFQPTTEDFLSEKKDKKE